MKKRDIVDRVAGEAGTTKEVTEVAVGGVFAPIAEALARGDDVTIAGFGRFPHLVSYGSAIAATRHLA